MTKNGVNVSYTLDVTMSALMLTPSGVGQAIGGGYFIINAGVTYFTGKDINQHIQGYFSNKINSL